MHFRDGEMEAERLRDLPKVLERIIIRVRNRRPKDSLVSVLCLDC